MNHLTLLGDSIFDNAAYVGGGPSVIGQVNGKLPEGWRATLAARDGSVITGVPAQLASVAQPTVAALSIGGNDALGVSGVIAQPARSVADALQRIAAIRNEFATAYERMLDIVQQRCLRLALCTIYDPNFPDLVQREVSTTALCALNDVILRLAFARDLPLIDLRLICDAPEHFANPIEPSSAGGDRIAAAIVSCATQHDFAAGRSAIYVR